MEEEVIIETVKKNKFRKLKRAFLILLSLFLVILVTGIVLANVYEKEIKEYAIAEINTHLKAKLKIDEKDVSFSFFQKFPNPTLSFFNVLIEDENNKDTLLFAESFSLEFGTASLFSGIYEVKKMELAEAKTNLKVDEKGNENYIFWKQSEETDTTESEIGFKLNEVKFKNVSIQYENKQNLYKADVRLKNTLFSGDFSSDTSILSISSVHYINELMDDSTLLFKDKESTLSVEESKFHYDLISIKKGEFAVADMSLDINCLFELKKKKSSILAKATNVEISDVFSLMPKEVGDNLQSYKTRGKVNGTIEILTEKRKREPKINIDFDVNEGSITENNSGVTLSELSLKGNFNSNAGTQRLELMQGGGNLEGGKFTITGKVLGKKTQTIFSSINGQFDLQKLGNFLNLKEVEAMKGSLTINNQFAGTAKPDKTIVVSEFTGTAKLNNAGLKLVDKEGEFTNFSGDIQFNRFTSNANFSGAYDKSDISISTQFTNLIPYLFYDQELNANLYVQSNLIELDKLIGNSEEAVNNGEDTVGVKLPNRIKATLRTNISKLTYQKHILTNLKGTVSIYNKSITTNDLDFNSNQGKFQLKGKLNTAENGFSLDSDIVCAQVEVSDLLKSFDDFGQTVLRHDHLNGMANAIIKLSAKTNKHLEIDLNSLIANMEFSITGGVLKNMELFDEIGEYLKSNAISRSIIKVDELSKKLKKVEFSEFTNTIEIKNRVITIPSMMLKTSVMDIGIYGTQTFDYVINYGINMRLKDLLTKKKDNEHGYIVDEGDGSRLFLLMTGTVDEPIFKLDKAGRKEFQQQERQAEKNNVKGILKDEFGLFQKDSLAKKKADDPKAKPKFEIDWEEDKKTKEQEKEKKEEKEKEEKKKKRNKWLDKIKGKEEQKKDVGFEIE